jgi:hypothetical protein
MILLLFLQKQNLVLVHNIIRPHLWGNSGKEPDSAFDYHSQSTLVRKMKSFGVDAEWIPGEERCHWGETTAMKPSPNHLSDASVAG